MLHTVTLAKFNAYFLSKSSRRATRTMLIPEAAICVQILAYSGRGTVTSARGRTFFYRVRLSSLCSVLPA